MARQLGGRPPTGHLVLLKLLQETPTTMALSSRLTRVRARWRAARNSTGSLPAQRAHSNAPAAPADCQCYPGRRASEPGRTSAARTAPSSSASPAATSTAQGGRVGGLPPSCRATPHPRHPASGSQLRVRKTLPRLARVTRRSGAAAQPPETATTASIRARDLAANSRGFLNQPNAAGGRKNRGSGLVRHLGRGL